MNTPKLFDKLLIWSMCLCLAGPALTPTAASAQATLLPNAIQQFFTITGKPVANGTVQHYVPNTTTGKTVWQDSGETTPWPQIVPLNSGGYPSSGTQPHSIYGDGTYRQIVRDSANVVIWDQITNSTGGTGGGSTATVGDGDAVGTIKPWAGLTAPAAYVFTYGQALPRVTFPELFSAITSQQTVSCTLGSPTLSGLVSTENLPLGAPIESSCVVAGTTIVSKTISTITASTNAIVSSSLPARFFPWGNGNGTSTFNMPDFRGKVLFGRDNMGSIVAGKLTSAYYGTSPDALGANATGLGGTESKTLLVSNLPSITPFITSGVTVKTVSAGAVNQAIAFTGTGSSLNTIAAISSTLETPTVSNNGGTSTPFSIIPPATTVNYIIKTTPDTNPNSYFGVASIGGMTGVLTCGTGVTCAGNTISAIASTVPAPTSVTLGGVFQSNAPANQFGVGVDIAGNLLYAGGSTTVNGQVCTLGGSCTISASAGTITVGTTLVASGTTGRPLFDNAGTLGEYTVVPLAFGGTNANLTASNGGVLWSNATQVQILAGTATARLPLVSGASATPAWGAFSLPTSVTSGGVPYFSSTSAESSSTLLGANAIMVGGGAGGAPSTLGSLGTTATVLHGNAAGAPTFGQIVGADITSNTVVNSNLAQAGAATLKGNPTNATANVSDFTIQGLTARGAPDATNDKIPIYDNAAGTIKYVTPTQVASAGVSGVSSLNGQTGAVNVANAPPGGRLTLSSGVAVMTTDVAAATSIYYAPSASAYVGIYNGTLNQQYQFTASATDTVGLTLALGSNWAASSLYDVFVGLNGGVPTLCTGPAWTSATAGSSSRSAALASYNGLQTNSTTMTCRNSNSTTFSCTANQCTYVGTFLTNSSTGQIDFKFGGTAAGGSPAVAGVWNMYNQTPGAFYVNDNSGLFSTTTINVYQPLNVTGTGSGLNNRITFVAGFGNNPIDIMFSSGGQPASGATMQTGVGLNSTTAISTRMPVWFSGNSAAGINGSSAGRIYPTVGLNYAQALMQSTSNSSLFISQEKEALTAIWWW